MGLLCSSDFRQFLSDVNGWLSNFKNSEATLELSILQLEQITSPLGLSAKKRAEDVSSISNCTVILMPCFFVFLPTQLMKKKDISYTSSYKKNKLLISKTQSPKCNTDF